jgi:hypothetical protein
VTFRAVLALAARWGTGSAVAVVVSLLTPVCGGVQAQAPAEATSQQWLFASTKVSYAVGEWRLYGDAQFRLDGNWRQLNQYLTEAASIYSPSKNWELQGDFRVTVRPERLEYRPGAGVTFKALVSSWQFAVQHKYQLDLLSTGAANHGLRQIFFVNKRVGDRFLLSGIGGWFYRWREGFNDIEFVRLGGGVTYLFDALHGLNVSYFVGRQNLGDQWVTDGFTFVGLSLNVRADWTYVPAVRVVDF